MLEMKTNTDRLTTTVAELNAKLEAGEHAPSLVNMFIETTTPATFASLYEQLVPRLQEDVVSFAKRNAANFDECIAWCRSEGVYAGGWLAFRDWARAQPWFPEALAKAEDSRAEQIPYEEELARQVTVLEGELPLAKSDEERAEIRRYIDGLRRDIERYKGKGIL